MSPRGRGLLSDCPENRLSEAEVILRLAMHLLKTRDVRGDLLVHIDGAAVCVKGRVIFDVSRFLRQNAWRRTSRNNPNSWQGIWEKRKTRMLVTPRPGQGDVVVCTPSVRIFSECKGGPLTEMKGSKERQILNEVIGQLITSAGSRSDDMLVAAVPDSLHFRRLVNRFSAKLADAHLPIHIALVGRDGVTDV